eukprot:1348871-Pyramimonas_sp.AAC.1
MGAYTRAAAPGVGAIQVRQEGIYSGQGSIRRVVGAYTSVGLRESVGMAEPSAKIFRLPEK